MSHDAALAALKNGAEIHRLEVVISEIVDLAKESEAHYMAGEWAKMLAAFRRIEEYREVGRI